MMMASVPSVVSSSRTEIAENAKKRKRCRSKSVVRSRKRRLKSQNPTAARNLVPPSSSTTTITTTTFEKYVETENFLAAEEHFQFFRCLRSPLPTNFRIRNTNTHREFQSMVRRGLVKKAHPLPGIVRGWQLLTTAAEDDHEEQNDFYTRRWLSDNTKNGNVSRQEFVSMLPVLLLDIQPHHQVLDLCASPGSKTTQAVDALYSNKDSAGGGNGRIETRPPPPPQGFCIANEINPKRAYILAHRSHGTLQERHASLAVVCHNAAKFPNVNAPLKFSFSTEEKKAGGTYDRIICDVPCSGDGTLRKDLKVWKTWHPSYGIALHPLQLRIAKRGIALLKVGGIMTYSTCSFHPIENEAVVAALLATNCVEILQPTALTKAGIAFRPGLGYWRVLNDDLEDIEYNLKDHRQWPSTLWPPPPTSSSTTDSQKIQDELAKCVRMVPQDNDTGGFFIAVLRKIKEFPSTKKKESSSVSSVTPKAPQHHLYLQEETDSDIKDKPSSDWIRFKRSPTGSRIFSLSTSLAEHVHDLPGSDKLNLVFAGYSNQSEENHK